MTEANVSDRTRRQAAGLKKLREDLGLSKPAIAGRLGFQSSQGYELYERKKKPSVLRLDQVAVWAEAFGVSEAKFLQAVGFQVVEPTAWNPRADLEAAGVPEIEIQTVLSDIADYGFDDQRESVSAYLELHAKKHNARTRRRA